MELEIQKRNLVIIYEPLDKFYFMLNPLAELNQRIFDSCWLGHYKVTKNQRHVQLFYCLFYIKEHFILILPTSNKDI